MEFNIIVAMLFQEVIFGRFKQLADYVNCEFSIFHAGVAIQIEQHVLRAFCQAPCCGVSHQKTNRDEAYRHNRDEKQHCLERKSWHAASGVTATITEPERVI